MALHILAAGALGGQARFRVVRFFITEHLTTLVKIDFLVSNSGILCPTPSIHRTQAAAIAKIKAMKLSCTSSSNPSPVVDEVKGVAPPLVVPVLLLLEPLPALPLLPAVPFESVAVLLSTTIQS